MKLKPAPELLMGIRINKGLPDERLIPNTEAQQQNKINQILSYLDYLREHIQNLEDNKHG